MEMGGTKWISRTRPGPCITKDDNVRAEEDD